MTKSDSTSAALSSEASDSGIFMLLMLMLVMLLMPVGLLKEIEGISSSQRFDFRGQRYRLEHGASKRQQQKGEERHGSCNPAFSVGFPEPTLLPANQVVMAMFLRTCCATQHAASDLLDTAVHGHAACFLWLRSNRPERTTGHTIKPTVVTQGMSIEK